MPALAPVPAALFPLVGCLLALCSIWVGWRTLRALAIPPLLRPVFELNTKLIETLQGPAAPRGKTPTASPDTIRLYGWAWVYAGTLVLIIAGGQLLRSLASALG